MKITVKIKPNSKKEEIKKIDGTNFFIAVKEPPIDGKANKALVKALAKHFNIPSSAVRIASGHTSKQKIIEIP
ncbi:DUF167 domain-containing protein [Candidatus Woesearchaeota archaeon]|nr:DUF167 domain-containing protein [Candidatus Woesearchaeota archaeon]